MTLPLNVDIRLDFVNFLKNLKKRKDNFKFKVKTTQDKLHIHIQKHIDKDVYDTYFDSDLFLTLDQKADLKEALLDEIIFDQMVDCRNT